MLRLLTSRRFLPLFAAQFLGATNDNLLKNAMALLIIYRIGAVAGANAEVLTTVATALFMLPYFLFSAVAGELADRFEKSRLMKLVKFGEIVIVILGAAGLLLGNVSLMFAALFVLGAQSTFFAPLKYAVLPEFLAASDLLTGNALIEGGTFLAILTGTIVAGVLILVEHGVILVSTLMLVVAIGGFGSSLALPRAHTGNRDVRITKNLIVATRDMLATVSPRRSFLAVLGISWFWALGAILLTEFPAYAKDVLGADQHAVTVMLAMFSVGIGAGSILCGRLLKGEISARHVPFAALGMAIFLLDLFFASRNAGTPTNQLANLSAFLAHPNNWRILFDLLMIAGFGGIFTVPLYTILQSDTPESERARAVAANNVVNAIFMVAAAGIAALLLFLGFTIIDIFLVLTVMAFAVALYICRILPDEVMRAVLASVLRMAYRVEVNGFENLKAAGSRVLVVANHASFLDAVLVAVFVPNRAVFAIDTNMAQKWWVRPFLSLVEAYPLDPMNPLSVKSLTRKVKEGKVCVIFPEGKLTRTGALMKVYDGPSIIAERSGAMIVPLRIDGAQYTPFSRLRGKVRLRWFPKITLTMLPPRRMESGEGAGRIRRNQSATTLYDLMSAMVFETGNYQRTLFEALLDARNIHGGTKPIIEDIARKPITYNRLTVMSLTLGRLFARHAEVGENVGLLLPNTIAYAASFLALQAFGRVPALLNYTAGTANALTACRTACVRKIVTSRQFVEQAHLESLVEGLSSRVEFIWIEDARANLSFGDRLFGAAGRVFPRTLTRRCRRSPSDPAVILFTSGSEGTPKGVVLSHGNLLANCLQLGARIAFNPSDSVFNVLPLFHSFGLSSGFLLPIISGVKIFLYPSPLDYRVVPELVYDTNSTILFGTNTFLTGYARRANPYDFYSVRYIFAGAEKIEESTRRVYAEKFGLRILEGYGATETAPVIACNTPMHYEAGSVGRFLPAIEFRLEAVPGIAEGGRLFVRGPNVMLGYMRAQKPGFIEDVRDGWLDTGDVVTIDEDGFVRIIGRIKRFAKIGGEMISLGQIETEVGMLWPDHQHAAVAVHDEHKGEQLVLTTDCSVATQETLAVHFRTRGLPPLAVPKRIVRLRALPLLGTGKIDYSAIKEILSSSVLTN